MNYYVMRESRTRGAKPKIVGVGGVHRFRTFAEEEAEARNSVLGEDDPGGWAVYEDSETPAELEAEEPEEQLEVGEREEAQLEVEEPKEEQLELGLEERCDSPPGRVRG